MFSMTSKLDETCLQDSAHCLRSDGVQSRRGTEHPTYAQGRELGRYWRWEDVEAGCDERVVGGELTDSAGSLLEIRG